MNMQWVSRIRSPYGGIVQWVDPISGIVSKGTTFDMLLTNAINQRRANGIPIGLEFEHQIEQDLCRDYPQECVGFDPRLPRPVTLDFDTVLRGTRVLLSVIAEQAKHLVGLAKSPLVEQTTADYRAMTCAACPRNVPYQAGCTKCAEVLKLVQAIKGTRKTPYDGRLKACGICGCSNEAQSWIRLDLLANGVTVEMKQQFQVMQEISGCWKQVP